MRRRAVDVEGAHVDRGGVATTEERGDHEQDGDDQDDQGGDEHGARPFRGLTSDPSAAEPPRAGGRAARSHRACRAGCSGCRTSATARTRGTRRRTSRRRSPRGSRAATRPRRGSRARRSPPRRGGRRGRRRSVDPCRGAARWRPRRCPTGRRSRTAAAGRSRRARLRGPRPGRSAAAMPDSVSTWSGSVHHTAVVCSVRSGRSSGSSPMTSPDGTFRFRNDTTWWETRTSPRLSRASPHGDGVALGEDLDVGDLAGGGRVVGLGRHDDRDRLVEVELGHQPGLALVQVDRSGVGGAVGRGGVDGAQDPAGDVLDQAHRRTAARPDVGEVAGAAPVGPEPAPRSPPEQAALGERVDRRPRAGPEQRQVLHRQRRLRGRGAQVWTEDVGVVGVEDVGLDRLAEECLRVVDQVGVQGVVARDHHRRARRGRRVRRGRPAARARRGCRGSRRAGRRRGR